MNLRITSNVSAVSPAWYMVLQTIPSHRSFAYSCGAPRSRLQRQLGHAAHVAGITGTFQSMDHDDLAACIARGTLLMDEYLSFRIGSVETFCYGKACCVETPTGKVREYGENVRILDDRLEGEQTPILRRKLGPMPLNGLSAPKA